MHKLLIACATSCILLSTVLLSGLLIRYFSIVVPHWYYLLVILSSFAIYLAVPLSILLLILMQHFIDRRVLYYSGFAILAAFLAWLMSHFAIDYTVFQLA